MVCALLVLSAGTPRARAQSGEIDAAALIESMDARLGPAPGTITLARPAMLSRTVELGQRHNLLVQAPLRVIKATVRLMGQNSVRCTAPISAPQPTTVFLADGASNISISNCRANAAVPFGYLLEATRSSRVTMTGNSVVSMGLFTTHNGGGAGNETTDVVIRGNTSRNLPPGGGAASVYLVYVKRAKVDNNSFDGNMHGVEWWGGDANGGWRGPQSVVNAGDITVTGNVCTRIAGSCVWGSMGYHTAVSGNSADGCGDVCFDVEGGVDNVFTRNTAKGCNFGCYAAEFESLRAVFTENVSSSDSGHAMFLLKHGPGNPNSHAEMLIARNTLTCTNAVCPALYTEGEESVLFTQNKILNGSIQGPNYHGAVRIVDNQFRFNVDPGPQPALGAPPLFNGHVSEVSQNTVRSEVAGKAATTCIGQTYSDYNTVDEMRILNNTCIGFDTGVATLSSGGNPGAPRAVWVIAGNRVIGAKSDRAFVHGHTSGNETYNFMPDNTEQANEKAPPKAATTGKL